MECPLKPIKETFEGSHQERVVGFEDCSSDCAWAINYHVEDEQRTICAIKKIANGALNSI